MYRKSDWKAVCWVCGGDFYASQMRMRWDKVWVCGRDWEPRHPQDFVRARTEEQAPPWTQNIPATTFTAVCFPRDQTAIPGMAQPGCAKPGYVSPFVQPEI